MSFTVRQVHLDLLKRMWVNWNDAAYDGAPEIDLKRPYGNSDVLNDVAEIVLGDRAEDEDAFKYNREGELVSITSADGTVWTEAALRQLHKETATVLQIALATQRFAVGTYRQTDRYNDTSWVLDSPQVSAERK